MKIQSVNKTSVMMMDDESIAFKSKNVANTNIDFTTENRGFQHLQYHYPLN